MSEIYSYLLTYCSPVNFAKFLRTPFLQNTSGRLLLELYNNSRTSIMVKFVGVFVTPINLIIVKLGTVSF